MLNIYNIICKHHHQGQNHDDDDDGDEEMCKRVMYMPDAIWHDEMVKRDAS